METTTTYRTVDKANEITAFASTDKSRRVLHGVHCAADYTEATDGWVMIRVPYAGGSQFGDGGEFEAGRIVPSAAIKEALTKLNKVVPVVKLETENGQKVNLTRLDGDSKRVMSVTAIEGQFPNTDQVWPGEEPKFSITLNGELLAKIAAYAVKHGADQATPEIRFDFTDNMAPVVFTIPIGDGRKASGVLMPMRMA